MEYEDFKGWPVRVRNCLYAAGFKTEDEVKNALILDWNSLKKIENFGNYCDNYVKTKLSLDANQRDIEKAILLLSSNGYIVTKK